ncbi:glycosyltransferase family 33 protein [Macrolepiota fuliginosa MF-IS2]|uniref:Chitobiosyldiphosphodolichol beta-mannosyltransferase n=1 Tax=Macrolepiota fuliginosa MF-IS2 TaxID=1400762 RepID=A0A9P5XQL5_9AGAR|nr:glycosyltransferase family 33 protein [Macrolepiota fuliginosa MF-IS2]
MMYHAQSFAENGFVTDLIGYGGSKPIPALERLPKLRLHYLPEPPNITRKLPFILAAPIKVLHQIISVLVVLVVLIKVPPEFILVQNPPSIPTLLLVQFVGKIRGCKVIIDWHNLGYSILALKAGKNHPLVQIAKWFEKTFGQKAYAHLFVTKAMKVRLVEEWNLQGKKVVLHDRPPRHFHHASSQETHELFQRLRPSLLAQPSLHDFLSPSSPPYSTPFTRIAPPTIKSRPPTPINSTQAPSPANYLLSTSPTISRNMHSPLGTPRVELSEEPTYHEIHLPALRRDRPALVVSSTSWTPDEDFSILLEALSIYELRAQQLEPQLPKMLVVVTGKGPLRDKYMKEINELQKKWVWVRCVSLWLEAEDYPILLGSADLGVCLHSSSSALDLPMKVVDMFGCGLPVCALKFDCLHELVRDGVNGLVFSDASQLAGQLEELLTSFPDSPKLKDLAESLKSPTTSPHLHSIKAVVEDENEENDGVTWVWTNWEENWGRVMRPLILNDINL